jgi:uncharacterized protein YkwD
MLYAVLRVLALLAATAAVAVPTAVAQDTNRGLAARSVVAAINAVRAQHGLRPLRLVRPLTFAAGQHSSEMGTHGYFSHDSVDGTSFWKRVEGYYGSHGYRYWSVGENLLWSSGTLSPESRHWRQIGLSAKQFDSAPGVYRGLTVTIVTADFGTRTK